MPPTNQHSPFPTQASARATPDGACPRIKLPVPVPALAAHANRLHARLSWRWAEYKEAGFPRCSMTPGSGLQDREHRHLRELSAAAREAEQEEHRHPPHTDSTDGGVIGRPKTMRARFKNLALIPGVRWVPHDLPHQEQKHKSRPHLFSLKSSSSSDALRPRKSTLSLTSEPDEELDARTHTQAQSRFFALLPLELRRMIYEYVVGAETIHLTFSAKKKFGHFVCEWADDLEGRECPCRVLVGGRACRRLNVGCAHMMRTCRRMYSEAIPYVYRAHTFSLLHLTHLLYLPTSLPQQRLNTIRVLRLRWAIRAMPYLRRGNKLAYREDTANWEKGWKILADMQGLRDLYVVLVDVSPQSIWERNWLQLEPKLLEPVKNITKPHWFELVLPFAGCKTDWDMGESRVTLRTPTSAFAEEQN